MRLAVRITTRLVVAFIESCVPAALLSTLPALLQPQNNSKQLHCYDTYLVMRKQRHREIK